MLKIANLAAAMALGIGSFGAARADLDAAPKTRAAVVAELQAARASHVLGVMTGEDSGSFYFSQQPLVTTTTRAQVLSEAAAERRSGELAALFAEGSGAPMVQATSTLTRAQVVAELLRARASGELDWLASEGDGYAPTYGGSAAPAVRYAGPDIGPTVAERNGRPANVG
jgi:hypothetical protein